VSSPSPSAALRRRRGPLQPPAQPSSATGAAPSTAALSLRRNPLQPPARRHPRPPSWPPSAAVAALFSSQRSAIHDRRGGPVQPQSQHHPRAAVAAPSTARFRKLISLLLPTPPPHLLPQLFFFFLYTTHPPHHPFPSLPRCYLAGARPTTAAMNLGVSPNGGVLSYGKMERYAIWVATGVASTFFASLERRPPLLLCVFAAGTVDMSSESHVRSV
jgi:hypothetical protein